MASPRARYRSVPRKEKKGRARSRTTADSPLPCPIQNHSSVKGIPEASRQNVREAKLGRVRRVSGAKKHVIGGGGVWVARPAAGTTFFAFLITSSRPTSLPSPPRNCGCHSASHRRHHSLEEALTGPSSLAAVNLTGRRAPALPQRPPTSQESVDGALPSERPSGGGSADGAANRLGTSPF